MLAVTILTSGCSGNSQPDPTSVTITISTSEQLNPNTQGNPSPVVMRVYELAATTVFDSSEFPQLFYNDIAVLGGEMLGRKEFEFKPKESTVYNQTVSPQTKFLGFIAGFRELGKATWRTKIAIIPETENEITLTVDSRALTTRKLEKAWWKLF
jgi:type VI secretion system protein VasD